MGYLDNDLAPTLDKQKKKATAARRAAEEIESKAKQLKAILSDEEEKLQRRLCNQRNAQEQNLVQAKITLESNRETLKKTQ